jgi:phosphopantothenoylcysteine decarboxylase / phosphopantothenate---cysteine ligase
VRFLITAGPTREPIDPVRFISNRSSGKMGYAIAEAAIECGHDVALITGPADVDPPARCALTRVSTSAEMFNAVQEQVAKCDVLVMAAAVADYRPARVSRRKIKKNAAALLLELIPTRDILRSLPKKNRRYLVVGFAAETENVAANARKKLNQKHCDIIVANNARVAMESDENEVEIFFRNGKTKKISRAPKKIIARELIKIFADSREKGLTKKTR